MAKVEAPNRDYNGPGPGGAVFENGAAETDDENALNYYRGAGYKVSGKVESPVGDAPEPPDPREVSDEVIGTRLRDAAVDPKPEDFLAPTNAGKGNPHGSSVVSPEIHASGPAGIRPGEVFVEDVDKQEKREKEFANARLVQRKAAGDVVASEVDLDDRGPLDLSDPGSSDAGRRDVDSSADVTSDAGSPAKKTAAKRTAKKS